MDVTELEAKIHGFIINLYKAKYKGRLNVKYDKGIYTLILGIPNEMIPTSISLQTDDPQEFLDYICDELKKRNYMRVYFYQVRRTENLTKNEIQRKRSGIN